MPLNNATVNSIYSRVNEGNKISRIERKNEARTIVSKDIVEIIRHLSGQKINQQEWFEYINNEIFESKDQSSPKSSPKFRNQSFYTCHLVSVSSSKNEISKFSSSSPNLFDRLI